MKRSNTKIKKKLKQKCNQKVVYKTKYKTKYVFVPVKEQSPNSAAATIQRLAKQLLTKKELKKNIDEMLYAFFIDADYEIIKDEENKN